MTDKEALERLDDARLATWDTHRPDAFVDMFADDFVIRDTSIAAPITTREGAHDYLRKWSAAFPDMRIRRTSRVVDDESVAGEVALTVSRPAVGQPTRRRRTSAVIAIAVSWSVDRVMRLNSRHPASTYGDRNSTTSSTTPYGLYRSNCSNFSP